MNLSRISVFLLLIMITPLWAAQKPVLSSKQPKDISSYIAIFDFDVAGKLDKDISRPLSDSVRNVLVRSGKFKVMDRANMDRILKEQAFQMTGSVQKDRVVEAGQFLGVGRIVVGSIGIVGRTYFISLSMVNIQSGETEQVEEETCKCELDELIESTRRVANKLLMEKATVIPVSSILTQPAVPLSKAHPSSPSGQLFQDPVTGMEFLLVEGGCFLMGDEEGDREEKPVHEVCVDSFYLGKYEVTQEQWKAIMGKNPSKNDTSDQLPVEDMSWNNANEFIQAFNKKTGRYFRLPTEAEWEYAARSGGKKEKWAGTNDESELGNYAWNKANAGRNSHEIGRKKPNNLGLHDMSGNVAEWVADCYDSRYYKESPRNNPQGPNRCKDRVYRGGSYKESAKNMRTAKREEKSQRRADSTIGFRIALSAR
ncbi:MAG: SUMF1/EgtB/PvdO family nonheme iron enzyme [Nitrospirota bacterium]